MSKPASLHQSNVARTGLVCAAIVGTIALTSCSKPETASDNAAAPPAAAATAAPAGESPSATPAPDATAGMEGMSSPVAERGEEIPEGDPVPTVMLTMEGEAHGVWTFTVATDATLTMATGPYQPMRGHLHVYVDGEEKQMIADKRFTLRDLGPGTHTIRVALAATNHRNLLHNGAPIAASAQVVVKSPTD